MVSTQTSAQSLCINIKKNKADGTNTQTSTQSLCINIKKNKADGINTQTSAQSLCINIKKKNTKLMVSTHRHQHRVCVSI